MEELYDKYFDKIYKWSLKKTNNKEDAEDLTNNVFISIFEYFNNNIEINKIENLIMLGELLNPNEENIYY